MSLSCDDICACWGWWHWKTDLLIALFLFADILNPPPIPKDEVKKRTKEGMMTEDEERELAELMGSDIEDDV